MRYAYSFQPDTRQSNQSPTAVLTAIAIPVFTSQLEKSREAVDLSNIRSYYAEIVPAILTGDLDDSTDKISIQGKEVTTTGAKSGGKYADFTVTVPLGAKDVKQSVSQWQTTTDLEIGGYVIPATTDMVGASAIVYSFKVQTDGDIELNGTNGITFTAGGSGG